MLASAPNGILYVGVTNDLVRRIYEHRNGLMAGFTKKYSVKRLVYFECYEDIQAARPLHIAHSARHTPPTGLAFGEPDDRLQPGIQYAGTLR